MKHPNNLRGYLNLVAGDETKTLHFSMNFVFILQDLVEEDLTETLTKLPTLDSMAQSELLSKIVYAGLAAYDLEEDNEVDYNLFKVRDWLFTAIKEDETYLQTLIETMTKNMQPVGKKIPKKSK